MSRPATEPARTTAVTRLTRAGDAVARALPSGLDLVLLLTLVLLLLHTAGIAAVVIQSLAIAALVHRPFARRWWFWGAVTMLLLIDLPYAWYVIVNHTFLITYWCLTLAVAFRTDRPERVLATSARLLIGLVFLFAVIWKLLSPDFLSGEFFEFSLLTDERFAVITETAGGAPPGATDRNRALIETWHDAGADVPAGRLESGPRIPAIADVMTWWGVGIEAALALLFLWPRGRWGVPTRHREALLLAFVATTYPLAPVVSFAWILLILGAAQTEWAPRTQAVYPALYVALHLLDESSVVWDVLERLSSGGL